MNGLVQTLSEQPIIIPAQELSRHTFENKVDPNGSFTLSKSIPLRNATNITMMFPFHNSLCSNDNNDKSQNEKYIAMHLDECIEKYEQELLKIPLNSLVNIFFHKERILNDHQKAYDFIIKESFSNINLNILLQSIDGEKLNIQSQFESLSKINERRGYLPIFNQNFLEPIMKKCEKLSELEKENQMLKEEINKITNQNNSIEDIESFILSINDKIKPEKGKTIIHWACENNRPDIVEYAISKKTIDINSVWTSLQSSGKVKKVDDSYENQH